MEGCHWRRIGNAKCNARTEVQTRIWFSSTDIDVKCNQGLCLNDGNWSQKATDHLSLWGTSVKGESGNIRSWTSELGYAILIKLRDGHDSFFTKNFWKSILNKHINPATAQVSSHLCRFWILTEHGKMRATHKHMALWSQLAPPIPLKPAQRGDHFTSHPLYTFDIHIKGKTSWGANIMPWNGSVKFQLDCWTEAYNLGIAIVPLLFTVVWPSLR